MKSTLTVQILRAVDEEVVFPSNVNRCLVFLCQGRIDVLEKIKINYK